MAKDGDAAGKKKRPRDEAKRGGGDGGGGGGSRSRLDDLVDAAYESIDGYEIARAEKKRQREAGIFAEGIQYGEIATAAFADALAWCAPKSGERFIDLGSGTGKAVLTAAATHAFSTATGVELLRPLHDAAEQACKRCATLKTRDVRFVCGDALEYAAWTDHDVVFVSLTCFTDEQVARVAADVEKLAKGSRVLVTSRALDSPALRLLRRETLRYGKGRMTFLAYERV